MRLLNDDPDKATGVKEYLGRSATLLLLRRLARQRLGVEAQLGPQRIVVQAVRTNASIAPWRARRKLHAADMDFSILCLAVPLNLDF